LGALPYSIAADLVVGLATIIAGNGRFRTTERRCEHGPADKIPALAYCRLSGVDRKWLTCGKIDANVKHRLSIVGTSLRGPAAKSAVKAVVAVHRMS